MSSDNLEKPSILTGEDINYIYSFIKERDEPIFFDYLVDNLYKKKEMDVSHRVVEDELALELNSDKRFIGFSDYYWYLSELITDKNLISIKELDKIEQYLDTLRKACSLKDLLVYLKKEPQGPCKGALLFALHHDERFLLIDRDSWWLRKDISKKIFRKPQDTTVAEVYHDPVPLVDLVSIMDKILADVEDPRIKEDENKKTFSSGRLTPLRYSLSESDLNGGSIKLLEPMKIYFPDHPMIVQIKVCGSLKEYVAYINNKTGYIRGLEGWMNDAKLGFTSVVHMIPIDLEKRVYRFFYRNEKNPFYNESIRMTQLQELREICRDKAISLTNLVLQVLRIFQGMEVSFDSIYEEISAIRNISKESVNIILEKLPFARHSPRSRDFWLFDDIKFNKFLILGLINLLGEPGSDEPSQKPAEKVIDKSPFMDNIIKEKDEKIKELEQIVSSKEKSLTNKDAEITSSLANLESFKKLADIRMQQINSLTETTNVLEKKILELQKGARDSGKLSSDALEVRELKKKLLALQEVLVSNKGKYLDLTKEKKELENSVSEKDSLIVNLNKEKELYLAEMDKIKKVLQEKTEQLGVKESGLSEKTARFEELTKKLEDYCKRIEVQAKIIEEQNKKIEEQDRKLREYGKKTGLEQDKKIEDLNKRIEIQGKIIEEQNKKIEEQSKKAEEYGKKAGLEQDKKVEDLNKRIEIQGKIIEEQSKKAEEQSRKISDYEGAFVKLKDRIVEQEKNIEQKNKQIEAILKEKELAKASIDEDTANHYKQKFLEKEQQILIGQKKLSELEKVKSELEDVIRKQKDSILNMTSVISDREETIKQLKLKLESQPETGPLENNLILLKEKVELLQKELEHKNNLYNTNLNLQFKLNNDIDKLNKKSSVFREILTLLSENLINISQDRSLNLGRIKELMSSMKSEDTVGGDSLLIYEILKNNDNAFSKITNMIQELQEANNLHREELEITKGLKERFEKERKLHESKNYELTKLKSEYDILKQYNVKIKQELDELRASTAKKSPGIMGKFTRKFF